MASKSTATIEAEPMTGLELGSDMPAAAQDVAVRQEGQVSQHQQDVSTDAIIILATKLATVPGVDKEMFSMVLQAQRQKEAEQKKQSFNAALAACQAEIPQVARDGTVNLGEGKGSYAFARFEDIDKVLRPIYTKHGFSLGFDRVRETDRVIVTGTLAHSEGHERTASFELPLDTGPGRNNLQAAGSSDTYGKRYIIEGFFNIVRKGKDDDGVAGGANPISPDEAAQIKLLVQEAGLGEGMEDDDRKAAIIEWFNNMLGYALPKGYISIRKEDKVRVQRALLSLKAKHLTTIEKKAAI